MHKSSTELKQLAKKSLSGKYGIPIGAYLIYMIISVIISSIIQAFIYPDSTFSSILFTLISLIVSLLESVFAFGLVKLYLDISRNNPLELGTLTYGFSHHPDRIIISSLLVSLLVIIWMIPAFILFVIYLFAWNSTVTFLLFIVALIFGIIMSVIYSLRYSQVFSILADNSETTSMEAMKESKRLMEGNLGRLFYLQISFFGWFLLGLLSCSIGFVWIIPYMSVTATYFYLDIKGELI